MAGTHSAARYAGYLGGMAAAAGVGAALAVLGAGTANADTDGAGDTGATAQDTATDATTAGKPAGKSTDTSSDSSSDTVSSPPASTVSAQTNQTSTKRSKPVFDPGAVVDQLKKTFDGAVKDTSSAIADTPSKPSTAVRAQQTKLASSDAVTAAADADPVVTAAPGWDPNPFRPQPPEPVANDIFEPTQAVFTSIENSLPENIRPFAREGLEFGYRGSQVVPFVNAIVPAINIVGLMPSAAAGDKASTQRIINNLIVTGQQSSIAFYGYDQVADTLNLELEGQALKVQFYTVTWDILDPFQLLHPAGSSGLPLAGGLV